MHAFQAALSLVFLGLSWVYAREWSDGPRPKFLFVATYLLGVWWSIH